MLCTYPKMLKCSCPYENWKNMHFVLNVKPNAVLKLLEQYGCRNTCASQTDFPLSPFSLN